VVVMRDSRWRSCWWRPKRFHERGFCQVKLSGINLGAGRPRREMLVKRACKQHHRHEDRAIGQSLHQPDGQLFFLKILLLVAARSASRIKR